MRWVMRDDTTDPSTGRDSFTYQRMLLPGREVEGGVIQTLHKVAQTWHVYLVLHTLGQGCNTETFSIYNPEMIVRHYRVSV